MRKLPVLVLAVFALSASNDLLAQRGGDRPSRPSSEDRPSRPSSDDRPSRPSSDDRPSRPSPSPSSDYSRPSPSPSPSRPSPSPSPSRPSPSPSSDYRPAPTPAPSRPTPSPSTDYRPTPTPAPSRPTPSPSTDYRPAPTPAPSRPTPVPSDDRPTRPAPSPSTDYRPSPTPSRPTPVPSDNRPTRPAPSPSTDYRPSPTPSRPTPVPSDNRPTRPAPSPSTDYRPAPTPTPTPSRPTPVPSDNRPTRPSQVRVPTHQPRPVPGRYTPPVHQRRVGQVHVRRDVRHVPRVVVRPHTVRYGSPRDYYSRVNRVHIYRRWIQEPVIFTYSDGYWDIEGYPYYVYRGYRYRYNPIEMCQYELVDSSDYSTVKRYPVEACTTAYDTCAVERDNLNFRIGQEKYFCAEAVEDDLQQSDVESYDPSPVGMSEAQAAAINAFLLGKNFRDIFDEAVVGKCTITRYVKAFGADGKNKFGCTYVVKVGGVAFPSADESVCSEAQAAKALGCDVGSQKDNTGCIMQEAILAGYCI